MGGSDKKIVVQKIRYDGICYNEVYLCFDPIKTIFVIKIKNCRVELTNISAKTNQKTDDNTTWHQKVDNHLKTWECSNTSRYVVCVYTYG